MPIPRSGENKDNFISRCMADAEANNSFPDEKQRYAFCISQFNTKGMVKMNLFFDVVNEENRIKYESEGKQCISLNSVTSFLNANKGQDITFDISTLGGDLATAITIHDLIKAYPNKTTANIVGLTASAGTIIADACDEVVMSDNALFLIHNGWKEEKGNAYDFMQSAAMMMKTDAIMVKIYREKTGLPDQKIKDLMRASDWLTPSEALEYGFIDRIQPSGVKIAASVIIADAQGKVNHEILTKLKEKMNLFGKKAPETQVHILALKDGKNLLINAELPAAGVEVMPVAASTLPDGDYELSDGRTITIAGGVITNVTDPAATPPPAPGMDSILGTVAKMLVESETKTQAAIDAAMKPLQAMVAGFKPDKGRGPVNTGQASVDLMDAIQEKIEAKQAEIRAAIDAKRKGA